MGRMRLAAWAVATAVLVAGCGFAGGVDGGRDDAGGGGDRLRGQAEAALARYDDAVRAAGGRQKFVPVGELTGVIGDLEPQNGDYKLSIGAGRFVAAGKLPEAPRATGEVVWADKSRLALPLVSAEQALADIVAGGTPDCGECETLEVTGARLATVDVPTTRGRATVPASVFSVAGTKLRVSRVAVEGRGAVTVTPPSWDPDNAPGGLAVDSASVAGGNRLTVGFTGAPEAGDVPCGIDYAAEAVESVNAVAVIVRADPHDANETCTSIGAARTATVELAAPLGERAVLEVQQGLPVPLTGRTG